MSKIVPFFENSQDNLHCLQSCLKSILGFYFPGRSYLDQEIDQNTHQIGGWSWFPPAATWLNRLDLNSCLYSSFDYQRFCVEGILYLKEIKGEERFKFEEGKGAYKNIQAVQNATREMIRLGLWNKETLDTKRLREILAGDDVLAIGKTAHEWLKGSGVYKEVTSHYVLVIKEYSPGIWRVHDPGLPGIKNRKIPQEIEHEGIFAEVLMVRGQN